MQTSNMPPQPRVHLTEARLQRGLSQHEIAEQIGTTYVNVSRWERGITRPSPYFRRKICTLFGKTEAELDLIIRPNETERVESPPTKAEPTLETASPLTASQPIYDPAIPLPPSIPLVGRDHDLAHIKQRLFSGGSVALTALNGLPGVGKTALSITLAHDPAVRSHFKDGILWAGLGPNPNMPGLLSRWGTLLGISASQMATLSNNEAWARAVRSAIGARTMLLVIDDAWQLEEALTFRVGGTNCAHLVTTRFPNIASHMTIDGATLIEELNEEQSVQLLTLLAPQVVLREEQKAHDLVQAVGGLPLALTLMGNYLRKQAYSGPARRISAALERLSDAGTRLQISEPHVPVESHPSLPIEISLSLQSVISVTDQLLSETARTTLYALSVFPSKPNTFSEEAALAVAACTTDELDLLSDAGLLESNGVDRYHLHQVIADYARLQLSEEAGQGAYGRLIAYITDYVETHKKDYELLELESGTILATLEVAYEQGKLGELVRAVCAFAPFLILRGFYEQAKHQLSRAYDAAVNLGDSNGIIDSLLHLGQVAQRQGDFNKAETSFQSGLTQAQSIGDSERICDFLHDLGWLALKRGEFVKAETHLREGLALARQIENQERMCILLKVIGSVAANKGDYSQAETYLQEGLNLASQIGNREQKFILLSNLGAVTGEQGKHSQAEQYFRDGLTLARQIGHREGICALLSNLGEATGAQENYAQAEIYFQEGLELARSLEHREWISALLNNLGIVTRKQKNYSQAEIYLKECLELARQIGRPQIISYSLFEYGNLYLSQNELNEAEKYFQEMLQTLPEGSQELLSLAQYGLARTMAAQGNIQEARKLGETCTKTLEAIGHRSAEEAKSWFIQL